MALTVETSKPSDTELGKVKLTLSYGPTSQLFDVDHETTLADFVGDDDNMAVMGYDDPWRGNVLVNGQPGQRDQVLKAGDEVEVIKKAGDKG